MTVVSLNDLNSPRNLAVIISIRYEMIVAPNASAHEGMISINVLNLLASVISGIGLALSINIAQMYKAVIEITIFRKKKSRRSLNCGID